MGDRMGHGMRGHAGMGGGLLMWADKLELTDQQQEQLKKMQYTFQMEQIDREADMKKAGATLRMLMHDDGAAESEVLKAIDNVSDLRADLKKKQYLHRKQMMGILTPEQIEKIKELRPGPDVQRDGDTKGRRGFGR
jgi:Spy/CpxP family protein refolding chaperone